MTVHTRAKQPGALPVTPETYRQYEGSTLYYRSISPNGASPHFRQVVLGPRVGDACVLRPVEGTPFRAKLRLAEFHAEAPQHRPKKGRPPHKAPPSYLMEREGRWVYRRRLPDVAGVAQGEFRRSLNTDCYDVATHRARDLETAYWAEVERLQAQASTAVKSPAPCWTTMTPTELCDYYAALVKHCAARGVDPVARTHIQTLHVPI